jgi:hypothetical protein
LVDPFAGSRASGSSFYREGRDKILWGGGEGVATSSFSEMEGGTTVSSSEPTKMVAAGLEAALLAD